MATMHYLWEFRVRPGCETEFIERYGPEGDWTRLFRQAQGYLGTQLLKDDGDRRRYLTIDRWQSAEAREAFLRAFSAEYQALDRICEALTEGEHNIGSFLG